MIKKKNHRRVSGSSRIADELRVSILNGELTAGTRMKSVRNIAEEYGVGRQIALSAFQILAEEGLIDCHAGRGGTQVREIPGIGKRGLFVGLVIVRDDLRNKFHDSLCRRLMMECSGRYDRVRVYETADELQMEKIASENDCLLLTGDVTNRVVESVRRTGTKFVTIGNYLLDRASNCVRISFQHAMNRIFEMDRTHRKSVGLVIGSVHLPVTRELVAAANEYSRKHRIRWDMGSVLCCTSDYGLDEIRYIWGKRHNWPDRLIMTIHTYIGFAQYVQEEKIPENELPELIVMVDDTANLPLPYPNLEPVIFELRDMELVKPVLELSRKMVTGQIQDGFEAIFDPTTGEMMYA